VAALPSHENLVRRALCVTHVGEHEVRGVCGEAPGVLRGEPLRRAGDDSDPAAVPSGHASRTVRRRGEDPARHWGCAQSGQRRAAPVVPQAKISMNVSSWLPGLKAAMERLDDRTVLY